MAYDIHENLYDVGMAGFGYMITHNVVGRDDTGRGVAAQDLMDEFVRDYFDGCTECLADMIDLNKAMFPHQVYRTAMNYLDIFFE